MASTSTSHATTGPPRSSSLECTATWRWLECSRGPERILFRHKRAPGPTLQTHTGSRKPHSPPPRSLPSCCGLVKQQLLLPECSTVSAGRSNPFYFKAGLLLSSGSPRSTGRNESALATREGNCRRCFLMPVLFVTVGRVSRRLAADAHGRLTPVTLERQPGKYVRDRSQELAACAPPRPRPRRACLQVYILF